MSYDLLVFAVDRVPEDRLSFLAWYERFVALDARPVDAPDATTEELRAWFSEIVRDFPPNSPSADEDDPWVTDYTIREEAIYAAFAWSQAKRAARVAMKLAARYGVGVYFCSSALGEVWVPDGRDRLRLAHQETPP